MSAWRRSFHHPGRKRDATSKCVHRDVVRLSSSSSGWANNPTGFFHAVHQRVVELLLGSRQPSFGGLIARDQSTEARLTGPQQKFYHALVNCVKEPSWVICPTGRTGTQPDNISMHALRSGIALATWMVKGSPPCRHSKTSCFRWTSPNAVPLRRPLSRRWP